MSEKRSIKGYLKFLEELNNFCACPELSNLYWLKQKSLSLEERCNDFKSTLNLENPKSQDRVALELYMENCQNLEVSVRNYYEEFNSLIKKKKIYFVLHDEKLNYETCKIDSKAALKLKKHHIITAHCNCGQQIEIVR